MVRDCQREAGPCERLPKGLKTKLTQGGPSLESTQIRWSSLLPGGRLDLVNGGQRQSKGELENNSRKPRDLTNKKKAQHQPKKGLTYSF